MDLNKDKEIFVEHRNMFNFRRNNFKTCATKLNSLSDLDENVALKVIEQIKKFGSKPEHCPGCIDCTSINILSCGISARDFKYNLINDHTFLNVYFYADLYLGNSLDSVKYVFQFTRHFNTKINAIETQTKPKGFLAQFLVEDGE